MTEVTGSSVSGAAAEPGESGVDEASLAEAFEKTLDISQDVELTESAASEETDREKTEQEDRQQDRQRDGQQDGQRDGQQDGQRGGQQAGQRDGQQAGQRDRQQGGQRDGQQDGQRDMQQDGQRDMQQDGPRDGQQVRPAAVQSSHPELKFRPVISLSHPQWVVGDRCQAVWSEDRQLYPATVVSVDRGRCRVRFNGYGNQEDVDLKALTSPDAPPTRRLNAQDWRPGSRCRAVYSEDGLVYPAVVVWVKGQRSRVRFDDYDNEEELDVDCLLSPDELHGPSRASAAKVKDKQSNQGKVDKEAAEKKRGDQAEKPTNHSFSFFPPFPPPPPQSASGESMSFIPPPPLWTFAGSPATVPSSSSVDSSSSMLMLWYMCGFHTGSYMAQQLFKSKD